MPYLSKAQQPQEQRCPFLPVCAVFSCVQTMVWLPVFGGLTCTEMLMHGIAHRHCTNTVAESALKRNRTGVSFAPGFLDPMLCQPNYVSALRDEDKPVTGISSSLHPHHAVPAATRASVVCSPKVHGLMSLRTVWRF